MLNLLAQISDAASSPWAFTLVDVVKLALTLIGLCIARSGLKTWKRQLAGKEEYDVAKRLLGASLHVRDAMQVARDPFIPSGETYFALEKIGITDDPIKVPEYDRRRSVYGLRMRAVRECISDLKSVLTEAEVLWGIECRSSFDNLFESYYELSRAVTKFINQTIDGRNQPSPERIKNVELIVYEGTNGAENDEFAHRVVNAIEEARAFCAGKMA